MSPILRKAFGVQLKALVHAAARQVASAVRAPSGQGLPTKSQLMKMGPQSEHARGSHRNGW